VSTDKTPLGTPLGWVGRENEKKREVLRGRGAVSMRPESRLNQSTIMEGPTELVHYSPPWKNNFGVELGRVTV